MTKMGDETVVLSGSLRKSPPEKKLTLLGSWQKRFFVLHSNKMLYYYKNAKEKNPVKGPINLSSCKCVESNLSHKTFKHVFSIQTQQRTYYLVAESQEDMEKWVETLCNVCGFKRTDANSSPGAANNVYSGSSAQSRPITSTRRPVVSPTSPSSVSSSNSSVTSPIRPCPLSVPRDFDKNKPRSSSDPPELGNTGTGVNNFNDKRRRQSEQVRSPLCPISALSPFQDNRHPELGPWGDASRMSQSIPSENYCAVPSPRPVSQDVYDILPQPKEVNHQNFGYERSSENVAHPSLPRGKLGLQSPSQENYDVVPMPMPMPGHQSPLQEDYDVVPMPRPVSQGSNRSSQDVYDMVPAPRPASDIYDFPPDRREENQDYNTPPAMPREISPRPWLSGPKDIYDAVPTPRSASSQELYDIVPTTRRTSQELYDDVPAPRPTSQELYDAVPPPLATRTGNRTDPHYQDEHSLWVPAPAPSPQRAGRTADVYDEVSITNRPVSADSGLNASFSSICSVSENGTFCQEDTYNSPLPALPVGRDSGSLSDESPDYDLPPPHGADTQQIYDVLPSSRQGNDIYDVPPNSSSDCDIYDVPPNNASDIDIYDVPPQRELVDGDGIHGPGHPTVDRSSKPPPQVNRAAKPKPYVGTPQYTNMPPPVNRDHKPRESMQSHADHDYINCGPKPPRPTNLPLHRVSSPGTPYAASLPNQRNQWFVTEDQDYCQMEPTRSEFTRCYSHSKNDRGEPATDEQCYEDMSLINTKRNSGGSSSSSSSSLCDNDSLYTQMGPPATLASSLPSLPVQIEQRRRKDLQYTEVQIVEQHHTSRTQMNSTPRRGSTHYTYINEMSTRALLQMSNERKEKSLNT